MFTKHPLLMQATIVRKANFNAAHRLNNPNWSKDKNKEVFGKCNNSNFHGHNYTLEVKVKGEIDPETGYVMDAKFLKGLIENEIVNRFDHKNLNLDTKEFANLNPTAENIAVVIYDLLKKKIESKNKLTVILHETERNFVEYSGE
jgi:6-pyruvoyltetrahydropterin/6-carboxytetrahydropterin synthase